MATQDKKYWHLHNHRLFNQLNDEEINGLCIISRYREANKGEMIFFTGESSNRIFILKRGVVKIMQTDANGNEVVKDVLHEHDLFGHIPGTGSGSSYQDEYALAASETVSICTFLKDDFEKVLSQNPQVSLRFATHIGDKMRTLEQKYNSLIFKDVRTRLLEFLVRYVREFNEPGREPHKAPNHLTQEDISQLIGSSRQSVATLLNELQKEGTLDYSRKLISLKPEIFQQMLKTVG